MSVPITINLPMSLGVKEAADALKVSEERVREFIASGDLRAAQPGRGYAIPAGDVVKLLDKLATEHTAHRLAKGGKVQAVPEKSRARRVLGRPAT